MALADARPGKSLHYQRSSTETDDDKTILTDRLQPEQLTVQSDASYGLSSEVVHSSMFFTCKHFAVTNTRDSLMRHRAQGWCHVPVYIKKKTAPEKVNAWTGARPTTHHDLASVIPDEKGKRRKRGRKWKMQIFNCRIFLRT